MKSMGQFSSVGMMFKCLGGSSLNGGNFMMQNIILNQQANMMTSHADDKTSFMSGYKAKRNPLDELGGAGSIGSRSSNSK